MFFVVVVDDCFLVLIKQRIFSPWGAEAGFVVCFVVFFFSF